MNIITMLPQIFYGVITLFWLFLLLISLQHYNNYRQAHSLLVKFFGLIALFSFIAAAITALMGVHHPLINDAPQEHWGEWAILALNSTAAIAATLLFTRPSLRQDVETFIENTARLHELDAAKQEIQNALDANERLTRIDTTILRVDALMLEAAQTHGMLDQVCNTLCEHEDFQVAWIGFVGANSTKVPISYFRDIAEPRFLSNDFETLLDPSDPYVNGPTAQAVLTGKTVIIENTQTDLRFSKWQSRAKFSQIASVIALPMMALEGSRTIGVLTLCSARAYSYNSPEMERLEAMNERLSRRVIRLNAEVKDRRERESAVMNLRILQQVMDTVPANIFWKDRELRYQGANRAFLEYHAATALEQIFGKSDIELGWEESGAAVLAEEQKIMKSAVPVVNHFDHYKNRWLLSNKVPLLSSGGEAQGIIGVHIDMTESHNKVLTLERHEKHFRELLENLPDVAIVGFDKERRILYWNHQCEAMFGYHKDEALGRQIDTLLYPEESQPVFLARVDSWLTQNHPIPPSVSDLRTKSQMHIKVHIGHLLLDRRSQNPEFFSIYLKL